MSGITVTKLAPFEVDGKLFQYRVEAVSDGAKPINIGYVGTEPGDYFSPLCFFPMEYAQSVQDQINELKKEICESQRKATGETSTSETDNG